MTEYERDISAHRVDAMRAMLTENARNEPLMVRRTKKRWIALGSIFGAFLITGTATAGFILLRPEPITDKSIVLCMNTDSRDANDALPGSSATLAKDFGPGEVDDAVDLCSQMWAAGVLSTEPDPTVVPTGRAEEEVPPLVVCVDGGGAAVVVPSENPDVCTSLRLSRVAEE